MILALKTDGPVTTAWLIKGGKAPAKPQLEWESGRTLADELLTRLQQLMAQHATSLADISGYIIYSGPGSFTSLRIGHTVLNTLADGYGVSIVGAEGKDWIAEGLQALATTPTGVPALPHYGSEANITRPRA